MQNSKKRLKLLLHICCAGCGVYVSQVLQREFDLTLFYYNPNIFPANEYEDRLSEVKRIAKQFKIKLEIGNYGHRVWLLKVRGHEQDPERGERCRICYRYRLEETAALAKRRNFDIFATTLTVSPHKDAAAISRIGNELADKYGLEYLDRDFKKKDGFKISCQLSRELNIHRQNYCGCEFSRRE